MTCEPRPERPGSEENPSHHGPLPPGQHILSNDILPDKDILNGARLRQRERAHLRSPKQNKHGGFSAQPCKTPSQSLSPAPRSTRLGCHQQMAETACPQHGFGRDSACTAGASVLAELHRHGPAGDGEGGRRQGQQGEGTCRRQQHGKVFPLQRGSLPNVKTTVHRQVFTVQSFHFSIY